MPRKAPKKEILYFPLTSLLKETEVLAIDTSLGILSRLYRPEQGGALLLGQVQFSTSELALVLLILQSHPYYCPDDLLWVSYNRGQVTEEYLIRARTRLQEARDVGIWDSEMRPVRNTLSRARLKLKGLDLGLVSILETGYFLIPLAPKPLPWN